MKNLSKTLLAAALLIAPLHAHAALEEQTVAPKIIKIGEFTSNHNGIHITKPTTYKATENQKSQIKINQNTSKSNMVSMPAQQSVSFSDSALINDLKSIRKGYDQDIMNALLDE